MRVSKKTRMTRITRIVRIGLTDKICEICEICGTKWRGRKPHPRPLSKGRGEVVSLEGEASPPAPLQRERGDSKLRGCDSQDRGIQTISVKSVKSVGQEWRGS